MRQGEENRRRGGEDERRRGGNEGRREKAGMRRGNGQLEGRRRGEPGDEIKDAEAEGKKTSAQENGKMEERSRGSR